MAGINPRIFLLGAFVTLCLAEAVKSLNIEDSEALSDSSLLSSISEAKQLVDTAYLHARKSLKGKLEEKIANPMDFLKHLKDPVGRTRSAVRAADYLETTLKLLKKKLQPCEKQRFNVTDLLDRKQRNTIIRGTGCDYQVRSIKCPKNDTYRTITGECNNRKHSHWGSSNRAFARWLPAEYEDGVSVPRGASEGKLYNGFPLPLVRKVSNEIAFTANENITQDQELSLFFMHWGQWVDHDIDLAPASGAGASPDLHCETDCAFNPPCFPIKFPRDDPRMPRTNSCMPFVQSASVCNPRTLTREQINAVSSFIDASTVYGSDDSAAKSLRNQTSQLGLLAVNQNFTDAGLEFLPFENNTKSVCILTNETTNIPCFKAGDKRVTENLGLSALHTVFLREHNRLVTELRKLNPHWDGEKLYQESRKIVAATIQIITYRDYLPRLLADASKWIPAYSGYNESVDPTVSNVFSLAFRFGHASVQPFVSRLDETFQPLGSFSRVPLHLTFCATWRIVTEGGIDPLIRGMIVDHAKLMKQNQILVEELQNHLFEQTEIMGLDLAALNIQRGRDHGLPGYNAWRRFCGLSQPRNVDELTEVLDNFKLAKKFMELYGTPDSIDLWIGAIAEPIVPPGRVGPLLACLIGTQFRNLRDGDSSFLQTHPVEDHQLQAVGDCSSLFLRFWWQKPGVFTPQQLNALSEVSPSHVICANTNIKQVPLDMFTASNYPEDFVGCHEIDKLDLSPWKQEPEQHGSF